MAELTRKEEVLATAELASYGIVQGQPDGPKLVKSQEPQDLGRPAAVSAHAIIF
jgi:hypothetical protein